MAPGFRSTHRFTVTGLLGRDSWIIVGAVAVLFVGVLCVSVGAVKSSTSAVVVGIIFLCLALLSPIPTLCSLFTRPHKVVLDETGLRWEKQARDFDYRWEEVDAVYRLERIVMYNAAQTRVSKLTVLLRDGEKLI